MLLIVYADVLIFLNLIVNYLLLCATSKIIGSKPKTLRAVLASFLGGISSLYIFLPKLNIIFEFLLKVVTCLLMSVICFGFRNMKNILKNSLVFFAVTCGYGGIMFAFWILFNPKGMVINNSIVYFNISPTVLVVCSVVGYIFLSIATKIFAKTLKFAKRCNVTVFANEKSVRLEAIVDTGNSIEDIFSNSEIIIADSTAVNTLFDDSDKESTRFRVLPCSTVSGYDMLEAFRCDSAVVIDNNRQTVLDKPLLAISKTKLNDGYNAIINPKVLR